MRLEGDPAVQPDDGDVVAVGLRGEAVVRVQVRLEGDKVLGSDSIEKKNWLEIKHGIPFGFI